MKNVTHIHASPQQRPVLSHPVTVGQWREIRAALRDLPAQIATATADEFKRRGYVPPADLPKMPSTVWQDDRDPF